MDMNGEVKRSFCENSKKNIFFFLGGGGGGSGGVGLGGQGGWERRIEAFVKIQKKKKRGWGPVGGSGVDVKGEVKFLLKFKKKKF